MNTARKKSLSVEDNNRFLEVLAAIAKSNGLNTFTSFNSCPAIGCESKSRELGDKYLYYESDNTFIVIRSCSYHRQAYISNGWKEEL